MDTNDYFRNSRYIWHEGYQKYKVTLEGRMRINTMDVKTKIESKYIFHVKEISTSSSMVGDSLVNLIAYDKTLLECSNQGFREMFAITSQFEKLYDEFEAVIDRDGKIKQIENVPLLIEKWMRIKQETIPYFNEGTDIQSFFSLNDETMQDAEVWKNMMNEQEFFFLFFVLPNYKTSSRRTLKRDNAFRSGTIDWDIVYTTKQMEGFVDVNVKGSYQAHLLWLKERYGKMPFFNDIDFQPNFSIDAQYLFDNKNGFIRDAWINVEETVHPRILAHQLKFRIEQID